METMQFEAVKIAMKQDKTGHVLTLNIHPDELPIALMRDYVGARYQVVMVRLTHDEKPMVRDNEYSKDAVRAAGILCRDKTFGKFLLETGQIFDDSEANVVSWLKEELDIQSRAELKENPNATRRFWSINEEFNLWKASV